MSLKEVFVSVYVRQLELGPMKNFVYLVGRSDRPETAVIDPAWDAPAILEAAARDGRRITHALVSHRHYDHCNAVPDLLAVGGIRVYAHALDASELMCDVPASEVTAVTGGEVIDVGGLPIRCIHTPGHTPGSQSFLVEAQAEARPPALMSGDTVFVNGCGRCDFEGGDPAVMFDSLTRVLGALPGETALYPGHDYGDVPVSSLDRERERNPYFQCDTVDSFVAFRMRPR